jgi:single-strand DNA-binding protein
MAKDLNRVQCTGYLGADPEMRYTAQGSAITTFRVATGRVYRDSAGERQEGTEWFRVVAWDQLGEICTRYLTKGSRVYIEGRLQTRQWIDPQGQERTTVEIVAQDMILLSARPAQGEANVLAEAADDVVETTPEAAIATPDAAVTPRRRIRRRAGVEATPL